MNKSKIILLTLSGIIILGLVILVIILKTDKANPDNRIEGVNSVKTNEVIKEQTVGDLKISNVSLLVIEGETNFYALVTNEGANYQIDNLYINFIGDNLDYKFLGLSNTYLRNGESIEIRLNVDNDLSNTSSVKYLLENAN